MTLNAAAKQHIRQRAKALCEYCHSPEKISTARFSIDHILPRSLGGTDDLDNLALHSLFHPRQQHWSDHFIWTADGTCILGTTATGRATCDRLDLNDDRYQGERPIQAARALWVRAGWHPPATDPRQLA